MAFYTCSASTLCAKLGVLKRTMAIQDLIFHLQNFRTRLRSHQPRATHLWLRKNCGYERDLCLELQLHCECKRYWDCRYGDIYLEIKKGRSIWLNEIRYAEILLQTNAESKISTWTMFIIPDKDREQIETIYVVDTTKLVLFLKLNTEWAEQLLVRAKDVSRSLNCQQSMTPCDVRQLANYVIDFTR